MDELQQEIGLNENQVKRVTEFLSEYGFIAVDVPKSRMRIKTAVRRFLSEAATS